MTCSIVRQKGLREFGGNESGAVTTDFVVITAAIVGLGVAVGTTVGSGSVSLAEETAAIVDTQSSEAGEASSDTGTSENDAKAAKKAKKKAERKKLREERKKRRAERKAEKSAKKK